MKRILIAIAVAVSGCLCGACQSSDKSATTADAATAAPATSEQTEVKDSLPTIYDFSATWCGPCKVFAPIFHEVAKEYAGKANFVTVDVDSNPEMAGYYGVRSVPTVVVVDTSNTVLGGRIGLMDKDEFKAFIKSTLNF